MEAILEADAEISRRNSTGKVHPPMTIPNSLVLGLDKLRFDLDWSENKTQELSLAMQLKKEQVSSQRSTLNGLEQRRRETEEKIQLLLN